MYVPKLARFTSRDPLTSDGTTILAYIYADSSPVNETDPSGMQPFPNRPPSPRPAEPQNCMIRICERPVRQAAPFAKGLGHIYVVIGADGKNPVLLSAGPGPVATGCDDIEYPQLRVFEFPWQPTWEKPDEFGKPVEVPVPDWPQEEEARHACTTYTTRNFSCRELHECMRQIGKKIRDCCIPYKRTPARDPAKGCNSNCAAVWIISECLTGKVFVNDPDIDRSKYTPPIPGVFVTPGSTEQTPDCCRRETEGGGDGL